MSLELVVLIGLATHRAWRLLAVDDLPLLVKLRERALGATTISIGGTDVKHYSRPLLRHWLECPWCSGLALALAAVALWRWAPSAAVWILGVLAVSDIAGLVTRNFDPQED